MPRLKNTRISETFQPGDSKDGRILGCASTDSPIVSGMFQVAPLPHQSGLRPASFPGGEAFVPGFRVLGFRGNGFRPFRCGTAHRPFPTVSLVGGRFQPGCSKDGRLSPFGKYMVKRPSCKNCQLSIVNCQFGQNCALSTIPPSTHMPYTPAYWARGNRGCRLRCRRC